MAALTKYMEFGLLEMCKCCNSIRLQKTSLHFISFHFTTMCIVQGKPTSCSYCVKPHFWCLQIPFHLEPAISPKQSWYIHKTLWFCIFVIFSVSVQPSELPTLDVPLLWICHHFLIPQVAQGPMSLILGNIVVSGNSQRFDPLFNGCRSWWSIILHCILLLYKL